MMNSLHSKAKQETVAAHTNSWHTSWSSALVHIALQHNVFPRTPGICPFLVDLVQGLTHAVHSQMHGAVFRPFFSFTPDKPRAVHVSLSFFLHCCMNSGC